MKAFHIGCWGTASLCPNILFNDPRSSFAFEGATDIFRIGDEGFLATVLKIPDGRLDLRSHGAFGEMLTFFKISLGLGDGHGIEPFLLGLPKVDGNLFNRRGDQKQLRFHGLSEQG